MNPVPALSQINQLLNQGQFIQAHPLVVAFLQQQADVSLQAEGYFLLGIINSELGQFNKASQCFEKALSLNVKPEYLAYYCKCQALLGNSNQALEAADNIDVAALKQPNALDTVGVSLSRLGFHERARVFFEAAIALDNTKAMYFYNYGMSLKFAGEFKSALVQFTKVLHIDPSHPPTQFAISDMPKHDQHERRIQELESLLASPPQDPDAQLHLAHALAIEYQNTAQHPRALEVLHQAKQHKLTQTRYDFARDKAIFVACQQWSLPSVQAGYDSKRPIFIVGMPRSGTTLVERILSHHSQVGSGGELQDFGIAVKQLTQTPGQLVLDPLTVEQSVNLDIAELGQFYIKKTQRIASDKQYFIDKLPFNFFYIDLIRAALPQAKIIVMLRDPMDTCIGNYRQMFSLNSPYYQYAFDLQSIGEFYVAFRKHIELMHERYGSAIRMQNYELLATNPEVQVKELLEFCDLPFESQCLHVEQNKTPVSTASKVQVREPINTSSIGRWKKFGPALEPLHEYLKAHRLV
ncbi:MAG: tetratricopeptide repeat protein [Alteromonadaceae bacterium]|nr:tetratricopeptide repeat protein [Alteromonadaceae bacterium]